MLNAACENEKLYRKFYSAFQVVENSTNEHHNDATDRTCAVDVHQWNEICEHKIFGNKNIDGSKASGFVVSLAQLLPT